MQTLDIILGLTVVYLLLSIACMVLNELIAQWLNWRPKMLRESIKHILTPPSGANDPAATQKAPTVDEFFAHPLITSLAQGEEKLSYIPGGIFVDALLNLILSNDQNPDSPMGQLRETISKLPANLRKPLLTFLDTAQGDLDRFRASVEKWYNDVMNSVSALYKRKIQMVTFILAILVTLAVNADTIGITRALSSNSALRDAMVAQAEALANNPDIARLAQPVPSTAPAPATAEPPPAAVPGDSAALDSAGMLPSDNGTTPAQPVDTSTAQPGVTADDIATIRAAIDSLETLGLPLGWHIPDEVVQKGFGSQIGYVASNIWCNLPGLILTMLAVSLGAPFWFDILKRFVNIRSSGPSSKEEGNKGTATSG